MSASPPKAVAAGRVFAAPARVAAIPAPAPLPAPAPVPAVTPAPAPAVARGVARNGFLGGGYGVAAVTFGPVCALLVMALVLRILADIPIGALTRDRVQMLGGPFYTGAYSTLGLLMWSATAAVCLFAAALLGAARREARNMFAGAAAVSLLLLADDMLLIHEIVFPRYFGIRDEVMLALLGSLALVFLFHYRRAILASRAGYMIATIALFAASLTVDALASAFDFTGHYLVEDGFKMLGIAAWASFWMQRCAIEVRARVKCRISA